MVTIDNVCWAYKFAIWYDIEKLKDLCEQIISENSLQVFISEDYIDCDQDLLIKILKMDSLYCKETDVFDACIAWANAACERDGLDNENMEQLRAKLGDAITQIRFCSMNIKEFAEILSKYKGFFTSDESNDIFHMIGKVEGFKSERFNQTPRHQPKEEKATFQFDNSTFDCPYSQFNPLAAHFYPSPQVEHSTFVHHFSNAPSGQFVSNQDYSLNVPSPSNSYFNRPARVEHQPFVNGSLRYKRIL